jgi:hypothetical protein
MPDQKRQPEPAEKKRREIEHRDLKPNIDPKGGAAKGKKDDKRSSGRKLAHRAPEHR